jgi:hypothetical protein
MFVGARLGLCVDSLSISLTHTHSPLTLRLSLSLHLKGHVCLSVHNFGCRMTRVPTGRRGGSVPRPRREENVGVLFISELGWLGIQSFSSHSARDSI